MDGKERGTAMSDHEILLELLAAKRKVERQRKIEIIITVVVVAILVIALIVAWVKISSMINEVRDALGKVTDVTQKVQGVFNGLQEAGIDDMGQSIKSLNDATEHLNDLYNRIGESGLQKLEEGLDALKKLSERLSGLNGLNALFG